MLSAREQNITAKWPPGVTPFLHIFSATELAETGRNVDPMPSKELDPRPPILALTICHLTRLHGSHRRTLQIHSCVHVHASTDANNVIMSVRMHPTAMRSPKEHNALESSDWSIDCKQHSPIETTPPRASLCYCCSVVQIWQFAIHGVHGEENLVKNWHNFLPPEASCWKYDLTLTSYPDCRTVMMLRGWAHSSIIHSMQYFQSLSPCLPEEDV